jgi:hypothetical protein
MGQVHLGFGLEDVEQLLLTAGLQLPMVHPLPPEPAAKGPALFLATAHRTGA